MERIEWAARLGIGADADGAGLFLVVHVHQHRTKGVVALYEWVEGQGDPFISYAEDAGRILETRSLQIGRATCRGKSVSVRVDLGGRRIINKKHNDNIITHHEAQNKKKKQ